MKVALTLLLLIVTGNTRCQKSPELRGMRAKTLEENRVFSESEQTARARGGTSRDSSKGSEEIVINSEDEGELPVGSSPIPSPDDIPVRSEDPEDIPEDIDVRSGSDVEVSVRSICDISMSYTVDSGIGMVRQLTGFLVPIGSDGRQPRHANRSPVKRFEVSASELQLMKTRRAKFKIPTNVADGNYRVIFCDRARCSSEIVYRERPRGYLPRNRTIDDLERLIEEYRRELVASPGLDPKAFMSRKRSDWNRTRPASQRKPDKMIYPFDLKRDSAGQIFGDLTRPHLFEAMIDELNIKTLRKAPKAAGLVGFIESIEIKRNKIADSKMKNSLFLLSEPANPRFCGNEPQEIPAKSTAKFKPFLVCAEATYNESKAGMLPASDNFYAVAKPWTMSNSQSLDETLIPLPGLPNQGIDMKRHILKKREFELNFSSIPDGRYHVFICDKRDPSTCGGVGFHGHRRGFESSLGEFEHVVIRDGLLMKRCGDRHQVPFMCEYGSKIQMPFAYRSRTSGDSKCDVVDDSPLMADFSGAGIELRSQENGVAFDIDGNGRSEKISWPVSDQTMFLVLDRNNNNKVDSGLELFGNHTRDHNGQTSPNGFDALAKYDDDKNGLIDDADLVFSELRFWSDINSDGVSDPNELQSLQTLKIEAIDLDYVNMDEQDRHGNSTRQRSVIYRRDAKPILVFDIWFRI